MTARPRTIPKRVKAAAEKCDTYAEFRQAVWPTVGVTQKQMDDSATDKKALMFNPKKILFYKDVWRASSYKNAMWLLRALSGFTDLTYIEMKSPQFIFVNYQLAPGGDHMLKGQEPEGRSRITGQL